MKSDTERKRFHTEKIHRKKNRLNVHLSKELRGKVKQKRRALLVRKGDTVKIMRGPEKGKEAKVSDVDVNRRVVFLEGIMVKNARGKEIPIPLQPSNLLLLSLEPTKERKGLFAEEAFRKKEAAKPPPREPAPDGHAGKEKEAKAEHAHPEHKAEHKAEHEKKPAEHAAHKAEQPRTERHEHKEHKPEHKAEHEHAK